MQLAKRATGFGLQTVWSTFTPLAIRHHAVNLGQGFPDIPPADFVKRAAQEAILDDPVNQYAPSRGRAALLKELARDYEEDMGRQLHDHNIMVTLGANQGIFAALQTFVEEGQSVLLIEPYFDIYKPSVQIVGGRVVCSRLRFIENDWKLDFDEMNRVIMENKVKVMIINTPHNPTGKVLSMAELHQIAQMAIKHDVMVISDEVYDELYYEHDRPRRLASLPGMWERCLTVGSAGKRFGVTGWRVGWLIGHDDIINAVLAVHSRTVYSAPSPLQEACAKALQVARSTRYFDKMRKSMLEKRDKLVEDLDRAGLPTWTPQGGYFVMANSAKLSGKTKTLPDQEWAEFPGQLEPEDYKRARWMTEHLGVACIPPSAFYEHDHLEDARDWLRFCFCKRDDTLEMAASRLANLQKQIQ